MVTAGTFGLVVTVTIRFHFNVFVFVPYFVHTKLTVLLTFTFDPTLEHLAPSLTEDAAETCAGITPQSKTTATATFSIFFFSRKFIDPFLYRSNNFPYAKHLRRLQLFLIFAIELIGLYSTTTGTEVSSLSLTFKQYLRGSVVVAK